MLMNHENGKRMLLELNELLQRLKIPFFLVQGTALGAYRDNGFTPTEEDIDIGILHENLKEELLTELVHNGFDTETFSHPFRKLRMIVGFKYGVKVDIAGFCLWKDKRFAASPVRPWITEKYAIVHDREIIETQEEITLFGTTFLVPSPITTYLEREYGADWRTPKKDHISRTRIYDYLEKEGIGCGFLDSKH